MTSIEQIQIDLPSRKEKSVPKRKLDFAKKLTGLLDEYDTCLVIQITNIGSKQIAEMRKEFRGTARFLFGKNSLIRKVIRDYVKKTKNKNLMKLMDLIKGNCGLVFTKEDIQPIRKQIIEKKKQCPAKCGAIAPTDVYLPIGPTNMEPTKTHIFQDMDIATRINRGQIDITSEKHIIKKGSKVGASEAFLLSQLNIKPFWYGISVESIYDKGEVIKDCSFMDMKMDDVCKAFYHGLTRVAALCVSLKYPTMLNVPHSILNAYKSVVGLGMMLDNYTWNGLQDIENALEEEEQRKRDEVLIRDNDNGGKDGGDGNISDDTESTSVGINPFDSSSSEESSSDEE